MRAVFSALWDVVGRRVRAVVIVAVLILILALWAVIAIQSHRLEQTRFDAETGRQEALLRQRERAVQQAVTDQQRHYQEQALAARDRTDAAIKSAREAEDAQKDLGDDRARRLSEHDRWLCEQNPALRGCGL